MLLAIAVTMPIILPIPSPAAAAAAKSQDRYQTIVVRNAAELAAAIGPYRTIVLKPNTYSLDKKLGFKSTAHFSYDKYTGGPIIKNVQNLTLLGSDVRATKILIGDEMPNVLTFENSQNIRIESIEIGHAPQSTAICLGAVLAFYDSQDIQLNDVNLFGSGTFGLWLENTHRLTLNHSVIKECSQGVVFLSKSKQIHLFNSIFVNNHGGVNLWDNSEIWLHKIQLTHNHAEKSKDYSKALFNAKNNSVIHAQNSIFTDNTAQSLVGEGQAHVHFWRNYMYRNRYTP